MVQLVHAGQFDLVPKISNLGTGISQGMQMANQFQEGKQKRLEDTQEQSFLRADIAKKVIGELQNVEFEQRGALFDSLIPEIEAAGIDVGALGKLDLSNEGLAKSLSAIKPLMGRSDISNNANKVGARKIFKNGLILQSTPKGPRVYTPAGVELKGVEAQAAVNEANEFELKFATDKSQRTASGQVVGTVQAEADTVDTATATQDKKDLAKVAAKHKAAAIDQLPTVRNSTRQISSLVGKLKNHPGMAGVVGMPNAAGFVGIPGTPEADFKVLLDQIKGGTFLKGFDSLKGGGTITEVEGAKAENALARLGVAQSEEQFKASLDEYLFELAELERLIEAKAKGKNFAPSTKGGSEMITLPNGVQVKRVK